MRQGGLPPDDRMKITWTAKNNSSYLNGSRTAPTIAAAVRAARAYVKRLLWALVQGIIVAAVWGFPFFLYLWNMK
jgi:hypothetical protein